MNPFAGMGGLTRNPLGILAIFLGVLYGIAGLLLGTSNSNSTELNQTLLTILVVLFPFISLATFGWLVAKHHAKLYSPTDFRTDEGFFGSLASATFEEADKKLNHEAKVLDQEMRELPLSVDGNMSNLGFEGSKTSQDNLVGNSPALALQSSSKDFIKRVEDLVFDLIGKEYDEIKRAVKFRAMSDRWIVVDGMGWAINSDETDFIEVFVVSQSSSIRNRSKNIAFQLK
jgi:hypothetical protein